MIDLGEIVGCLEDLITYFAQPDDEMSHEDKQKFLKALKNRQDLFQEEGILNLVLEMIDKMNEISASGMLSSLAGEESGQQWEEVSTYLFQLLAAIIKGNHTNCSQFAQAQRLNWLFSKLGGEGENKFPDQNHWISKILQDQYCFIFKCVPTYLEFNMI
jgi:ryanodine receptor 2